MPESENREGGKEGESLSERVLREMRTTAANREQVVHLHEAELVPSENSGVLEAVPIPLGNYEGDLGFLAKIQIRNLRGKAALDALSSWYKGNLEILKAYIEQQVAARKTGIAAAVETYFLKLDKEHVKNMSEFGVANAALRWEAVTKLTAMSVAKVHEVENQSSWPEDIRLDTIRRIFELRMQVSDGIMEAVGKVYSK